MTRSIRTLVMVLAAGMLAARSAWACVSCVSYATVPCSIVLVGHDFGATAADPYGQFSVVIIDANYAPLSGATITVDFSACCPSFRLSNTQLGAGVSHVLNSAQVTAVTDVTGTATFRIEGAATGALNPLTGAVGCATISLTIPGGGFPIMLTNGIDHPTVIVAAADLAGVVGTSGVDITDLSFYISDKQAYVQSTANYHQRSDFDFHLPVYNCSAVFNPSSGFGVNIGDLGQWLAIKNSARSFSNGPFPSNCP
jgi:hypothetical protein